MNTGALEAVIKKQLKYMPGLRHNDFYKLLEEKDYPKAASLLSNSIAFNKSRIDDIQAQIQLTEGALDYISLLVKIGEIAPLEEVVSHSIFKEPYMKDKE